MSVPFDVLPPAARIEAQPGRTTTVTFTVRNRVPSATLALITRHVPAEAAAWVVVQGPSERPFTVDGVEQVTVAITPPAGTGAAEFQLRLRVARTDSVEEELAESDAIPIAVRRAMVQARRGFPWWVVAFASIGVVVAGVVTWVLVDRPPPAGTACDGSTCDAGTAQRPDVAQTPPDGTQRFAVPVAGSPTQGPAQAKVTIVEALDFSTPFCARVRPTLVALQQKYGSEIRLVHKPFPIREAGQLAAMAGCAAHRQGRYWPMEEALWRDMFEARDFTRTGVDNAARHASLDMNRFARDIEGSECTAYVLSERVVLRAVGVEGVPTFFINGRKLAGSLPSERFEEIIDAELAIARRAVAEGRWSDQYYHDLVLRDRSPDSTP